MMMMVVMDMMMTIVMLMKMMMHHARSMGFWGEGGGLRPLKGCFEGSALKGLVKI